MAAKPPDGTAGGCVDWARTGAIGLKPLARLAERLLVTLAENAESELGEIMGRSMRRID